MSNHLDEEGRDGFFALFVFLVSRDGCVALPRGAMGLSAVCKIVVFPDHTHLLFLMSRLLCLCCVVTVKSFPILAFNVAFITAVRIYT